MRYRTKRALKRAVKQAAFWAAFFVVASIAVVLASFLGADLADQGQDGSRGAILALAGLGVSIVLVLAIIGLLCSLVEDRP